MALLEANGIPVVEGVVSVPRTGRAVARVRLVEADSPVAQGDAVVLAFESGPRHQMTCERAGPGIGGQRLLLVGGAGKLDQTLKPKSYQGIPAKLAILDVLNEVGERPGQIEANQVLTHYIRLGKPAYIELSRVLGEGQIWRCNPDGTIYVGLEQSLSYPNTPDVLEGDFSMSRFVLPLTPDLRPPMRLEAMFLGKLTALGRVERVDHHIGGRNRTEVLCG
jgi:hypothetical protein